MNTTEIEKLRELAQKALSDGPGVWPFHSAAFKARITPQIILDLIERATTESQITSGKAESIDSLKPEDIIIESWDRHPREGMQVGMPNGVRLIHKPTATVICVDSNRSQHRNKSLAMDGLRAILESPKPWEKAETKRMLDTAAMYQDLYSKAIERAEKAEAERDYLKAIAERQAAGPKLYGWLTGDSSSHRQGCLEDVTTNKEWAQQICDEYNADARKYDSEHEDREPVALYILSPAQQEPAKFPPLEFSHDVLGNKVAASATDAGQAYFEEQPDGTITPVDPDDLNASVSHYDGLPPLPENLDIAESISLRSIDCPEFLEMLGAYAQKPDMDTAWAVLQCADRRMHEIMRKRFALAGLGAAQATPEGGHPQPNTLFDRKLAHLQQRDYEVIGRILHKDGEYALFDSSCRWLTRPQYWRLMHEQDGSLFAEPKAAKPVELTTIREAILTYYDALTARQHGGIAQDKAFSTIQEALGMSWQFGVDHRAVPLQQVGKPNADCSGDPASCPDNEGHGCACDPLNKAAGQCAVCAGSRVAFGKRCECVKGESA